MLLVTNLLSEQIHPVSTHLSTWSLVVCRPAEPLPLKIFLRLSHLSLVGSRERVYWGKKVWKRLWSSKTRSLLWLTVPKLRFFHWNLDSLVHCDGTGHVSIWGPLASSRNVYLEQSKANSNQEDNCTCFLSANRAAEHPDVCSCGWV